MEIAGRKTHPAADLFAMLAPDKLSELADDIRANGLLEPITLLDGRVLDGRNRLSACEQAGVEPTFTTYTGDSPVAFVWSKNFSRRHMTTSQRAAVGVLALPMLQEEARKRQEATRARPGEKANLRARPDPASPKSTHIKSTKAAAALVGVGGESVRLAAIVQKRDPELFKRIEAGEITVNKAHAQVIKTEIDAKKLQDAVKRVNKPRSERANELSRLAAEGYRAEQIAQELGVVPAYVRRLAREEGITLPDKAIGRVHRINARRVIEQTVHTLAGCALGLGAIDGASLNIEEAEAAEWAEQIGQALRPINKLRKQLKEFANVS